MTDTKPPEALDRIVDRVLAYKPKPKSKLGKKRKQRAAKIARAIVGRASSDEHDHSK